MAVTKPDKYGLRRRWVDMAEFKFKKKMKPQHESKV